MKVPLVAPSLLAADFSAMGAAVESISRSGADWAHLDVMDGRFVPNLSFGPKMVADLRGCSTLPFDVHLMTVEPESLIAPFADAGADLITFHVEATVHAHRHCEAIRKLGRRPGISLVPSTPLSAIEELLAVVDQVLVMTVNPGFGGQSLLPSCLDKVRRLAAMRKRLGLGFLISVDGGIGRDTAALAIEAGADVLVMGSAFFGMPEPAREVAFVKGCMSGLEPEKG
jgi:ribulose-phosphate 3-epimerase